MVDEEKKKYPRGKNPNSLKNLSKGRPLEKGTERQREICSKGGQAFKKKKEEEKLFLARFKVLAKMPLNRGDITSLENVESFMDLTQTNMAMIDYISAKMWQRAGKGDLKAIETIMATFGEAPTQNVNVQTEPILSTFLSKMDNPEETDTDEKVEE